MDCFNKPIMILAKAVIISLCFFFLAYLPPAEAAVKKPTYTLVAKMATYPINIAGKKYFFKTRTWTLDGAADDQILGPTLIMKPGETVTILVKNEMYEKGEYKNLGPKPPKPEDWLPYIDQKNGRYAGLVKNGFVFSNNCTPKTPMSKFTIDKENIPRSYNYTNLHLHGLEVETHLFYPQGTIDPKAPYITIKPGEEYLYTFHIAKDQPSGTYWYHIHLHGSVAMQAWNGMAGLLYVVGKTDQELKKYNVKREIPFVIWDPHFKKITGNQLRAKGFLETADFLTDQTDQADVHFLVDGKYKPTFHIKSGQVVRFRILVATSENLASFKIIDDATGKAVPYYVMATDGIAYPKPVKKTLLVMSGGQRKGVLLRIKKKGAYTIMSVDLGGIQFFKTGPEKQVLAKLVVTAGKKSDQPTVKIKDMVFTPGKKDIITAKEVMRQRHLVFDIGTDTCKIPFPQFTINDKSYKLDDIFATMRQGDVEEWIIMNPNYAVHPFHIHVNPFQVIESVSGYMPNDPRMKALTSLDIPMPWVDTFVIPPQGYIKIRTRLLRKHYGKTVFHCHFLAHEDTGMAQNIMILPKKK